MLSQRSEWERFPSGLRRTLAISYAAGAAVVVAAVILLALTGVPLRQPGWWFAAAVAVIAVGEGTVVRIRVGHHLQQHALGDVALVLTFALFPPVMAVPAAALGALVAHASRRKAAIKVAFNVSTASVGYALAAVPVALAVGGPTAAPAGSGPGILVGLAAAAVVYTAVCDVATTTVVALASGTPVGALLRERPVFRVLTLAGNVALGLGGVALARWSIAAVVVLIPAAVVAYVLYQGRLRLSEQRNAWRQLNAAGTELAELDLDGLRERALDRARELFRPDTAQILTDGRPDPTQPERPSGMFAAAARRLRPPKVREVLEPLPAPGGPVAWLRLGFDSPVAWATHEQQVFTAFAQLVGAALSNAQLYTAAAHDAIHDALTGLGNRRMLAERAPALLAANEGHAGLLLIDLDRFKDVNDTLGHGAGDLLLQSVGERVRHAVRAGDLVVRLGGDEFAVLVTGLHSPEAVEAVGAALTRRLAEPTTVGGVELAVEASVGIACYPGDGDSVDVLLQHADIAMYQAKRSADRYQRFRPASGHGVDAMTLAADLRRALDDGGRDLHLEYTPVVSAATGDVARLDAQLVWDHPGRRRLTAAEFVPTVEESVLIRPLASLLLSRAVSRWAEWRAAGHDLDLSITLSTRNLQDPTLPAELASLLLTHGLPAERLTLAVTGPAVVADNAARGSAVAAVVDLGIRLAVGDVTPGQALLLLPAEVLRELRVRPADGTAPATRATVHLAHTLGLGVVALEVADEAGATAMVRLGCDLLQGPHAGAPIPATDLADWLDERPAMRPMAPLASVVPIERARSRS